MSSLPKIGGGSGAVNTLVAIGVTIFTAIVLFVLTTSYTSLVGRIDRLEASQSGQNEGIAAIHVQLDTINQRGTFGADTRLSALEARVSINELRISRLEGQVNPPRGPN